MACIALRPFYCAALPAQPRKTATKRNAKPAVLTSSPALPAKKVSSLHFLKNLISVGNPNPKPESSLPQVLVPVGLGTEEMEAVILVDVLRRAGADVVMASVEPDLKIEGSGGTKLVSDAFISSCSDKIFDLVALPVSI